MIWVLSLLGFVLCFILSISVALWIYSDAKKRGMSPWWALLTIFGFLIVYPTETSFTLLPILTGLAGDVVTFILSLITTMIYLTLVVIGWLVLRSKHPLITPSYQQQMQPAQQPVLPIPQPAPYLMVCSNCRKPVQPDWVSCPYCGTLLKVEEEIEEKRRLAVVNTMEELLKKESNFFVEDVKSCLSKNDIESAEKLLEEKKRLYDRFLELKKDMSDIDKRTAKLSTKLAEGEVTSDAYERAREDLEREKRDIEEEIWRIQNKIFREKYEKPF